MRFRTLLQSSTSTSAFLMMLCAPVAAFAADDPKPSGLGEIVVTAQRREESSQKVPISITVLSGKDVAEHFKSSSDIAQMVPNIQLSSVMGFGIPRTGIRGIAQGDFNANATTSNMIYIDDLPMDVPISQGVPLWDLNRVEVLRGPQGTLFGRNATGGAIRFITATPTDKPEGYVEFSVGHSDQRNMRAAISGPITNTLSARVSFVSEDFGGEFYNPIRHEQQGKQKYTGVRGILQWEPTDNIKAVLRAQYFTGDQDIFAWKTTPGLSDTPDNFVPSANGYTKISQIQAAYGFKNLGPSSNYYTTETGTDPNEHIEHIPVSLNVDWDLGFATLTSVTGYVQVKQNIRLDNDSSPAAFLDENDFNRSKQWSQEVRLTSKNDGPFNWIAGAFYLKETVKANLNWDATAWRGNGAANGVTFFPDAGTVAYTRGSDNKLETYAAFLHTTYQITPKLMLTAAARYTKEQKRITYRFRSEWDFPTLVPRTPQQYADFLTAVDQGYANSTLLAAAGAPLSGSANFNQLTWKLGLDYQMNPSTLIYTLVSRGFKGGAFTPTANTASQVLNPDGSILTVKPEIVTDYEVGVKADIIPRRLRVNGGLFYYDYKDYQTNQLVPALAIQVLSNLPKSELYGAELEVTAVPIDHLTLSGGMGLVHTEIKKSTDPSLIGNKLPLAEDFNFNALVRYDIQLGFGTLSPEVTVKHVGSYYGVKENPVKLGDYTIWNARIGFETTNEKFYGSVWMTNIGDTIRAIGIDDPGEFWGSNTAAINQHRRYGLTVGARF